MNKLHSTILADMSAIRKKGISYHSNNYRWPVSDDEFYKFEKYVHNTYIDLILRLSDKRLFDIACVEYTFVGQLVQILHYNYIKNYSVSSNMDIIFGRDSEMYKNPDWNQLANYYRYVDFPFGRTKRFFRRIIKNIVFNRHISFRRRIKGAFFGIDNVSIGSNDKIKEEYIKSKDILCDYMDWPDLLGDPIERNDFGEASLSNDLFSKVISPFVSTVLNHNSLFVKGINAPLIEKVFNKRAYDVSIIYDRLIKLNKPCDLLVAEVAHPMNKIITIVYQRSGYNVYCFHHGNDASFSKNEFGHQLSTSHCKNFIVPTKGIAKRYSRDYSSLHLEKRVGTEYININSNYMYSMFTKNMYHSNSLKNIERIVIMGYPAHTYRYSCEGGMFFYHKSDLEYRLIKFIKSLGVNVCYKAHPDTLESTKGLYEGIVDEIVVKNFEDSWKATDLLLFTYTSSSTFGYALTTNLPIVLVDPSLELRDREDVILMQKRVNFIKAKVNKIGRVIFNKEELASSILSVNIKQNFEYVQEIYGVSV